MAGLHVDSMTDGAAAIAREGRCLAGRPVELNVIWSVMKQRADSGGAGRYWLLEADGESAGILTESPPGHVAAISPMRREHVDALAGAVFTPPKRRRRRYAAACVGALCEWVRSAEGANSVLYAQLADPGSNAICRRPGFEAVAEALTCRFDEVVAGE